MERSSDHTVRHGSSWGIRTGLCVLVCVVAGVGVYLLGLGKAHEPASYTATATICQDLDRADGPGAGTPQELPKVDAAAVQRQIVSGAALRRALDHLLPQPGGVTDGGGSPAGSEAIERVRDGLQVAVTESSTADQLEIAITYTGGDPERVVGLVNNLAEQYAEDHHSTLEAAVRQAYRQAHSELETARRELHAARSHLEWSLQRHFRENQARAEPSATPVPGPPSADEPAATPTMMDNPEWVELDRRREELARRRSDLLVDRTPAHPQVRDIDLQIVRLKQHLAGIPRKIPNTDSDSPAVVRPPTDDAAIQSAPGQRPSASLGRVLPSQTAEERTEAAQEFVALKQTFDQAQQTHDRLAEREREAWQRRLEIPRLRVQLARGCKRSRSTRGSAGLLLAALFSGLVVAAGAGMLFAGLSGDGPYHTLAQAHRKLPVPVVGTVWAINPSQAEATRRRSPLVGETALVVYGLILIAIWLAILFAYITYTL